MTTEEFKANVLQHYTTMYRVAASVLGNDDEAADVVQDAMIKLWEKRSQLKNVSDIKSYCINTVRNACLNIIQRRKVHFTTEPIPDTESGIDIQREIEYRDFSGFVNIAIERLPSEQKQVFKLSAYGGLSNAEIADLLSITQGNVRVLLSRARMRIRELLSK